MFACLCQSSGPGKKIEGKKNVKTKSTVGNCLICLTVGSIEILCCQIIAYYYQHYMTNQWAQEWGTEKVKWLAKIKYRLIHIRTVLGLWGQTGKTQKWP